MMHAPADFALLHSHTLSPTLNAHLAQSPADLLFNRRLYTGTFWLRRDMFWGYPWMCFVSTWMCFHCTGVCFDSTGVFLVSQGMF